jgi:hypothetical protein
MLPFLTLCGVAIQATTWHGFGAALGLSELVLDLVVASMVHFIQALVVLLWLVVSGYIGGTLVHTIN